MMSPQQQQQQALAMQYAMPQNDQAYMPIAAPADRVVCVCVCNTNTLIINVAYTDTTATNASSKCRHTHIAMSSTRRDHASIGRHKCTTSKAATSMCPIKIAK
jgi:hypothetical protein